MTMNELPVITESACHAPASVGGGVCAAVHGGSGGTQHRVHRPAVRVARSGGRVWAGHGTRCGSSTPIWAVAARARPGRSGFAELTTLVGLGQVGIVLALEVSRLARNNSDWYRLLDLAGMTNTLLADADGVYHPGLFNDRMLLGPEGNHVGSRTARAAGPAGRRDTEQGPTRGTAPRPAGRAGLG